MKTILFLICVGLTATVGAVLYQREARHLMSHTERLNLAVEAITR